MFKPYKQRDKSNRVAIKMRHDKDTIYVSPDQFAIAGRSFELRKPFAYKIAASEKERTIVAYAATDPKGATYIHVEESVAPELPPPEPELTKEQKEAGKKPRYPEGGRPNRILSAAQWYAETRPGEQPPADGVVGKRRLFELREGHTSHLCLFRVQVPAGPVDLTDLEIQVWTSIEGVHTAEVEAKKKADKAKVAETIADIVTKTQERAAKRHDKAIAHKLTLVEKRNKEKAEARAERKRRASTKLTEEANKS